MPVAPFPGVSQLAVGAGSLWAINPDGTVSRFDAETGELQTTVAVEGDELRRHAGGGGVWVVGEGPNVTRIDPKTNRRGKTIPVCHRPRRDRHRRRLGVGGAPEGRRLEDRARRRTRREDDRGLGGRGVVALAFGEGALWAANYADGTVARIDPATNEVTRMRMPGNLQGIAAGAGSAWVSVVGGTAGSRPPAGRSSRAGKAQTC